MITRHRISRWISGASTAFTSEPAQALVAALQPLLAGESAYADEVPVGGEARF